MKARCLRIAMLVGAFGSMPLGGAWGGPLVRGHVHKAPHGGVIAHVGDDHVELVVSDGLITVWLTDRAEKVIPPGGEEVRVAFKVKEKPAVTITLHPKGDRREAKAQVEAGDVIAGRVEVRRDKKVLTTSFQWSPLDARQRLNDQVE
jgi:hypothetical protein